MRTLSDVSFLVALALLMAGAGTLVAASGLFSVLRRVPRQRDADPRPGVQGRSDADARDGVQESGEAQPAGRARRPAVVLLAIGGCFLIVAVVSAGLS